MITFFVAGEPAPSGSKRGFVNRKNGRVMIVDDSPRTKPWQALIATTAIEIMSSREMFEGPVSLKLTFIFRRPKFHFGTGKNLGLLKPSAPDFHNVKPDLTKLVRCVEDALTGVCWLDDSAVVRTFAEKLYANHRSYQGVHIRVELATETLRMESMGLFTP